MRTGITSRDTAVCELAELRVGSHIEALGGGKVTDLIGATLVGAGTIQGSSISIQHGQLRQLIAILNVLDLDIDLVLELREESRRVGKDGNGDGGACKGSNGLLGLSVGWRTSD